MKKINVSNFFNKYLFNPLSNDLSTLDKIIASVASTSLFVLTLGLVPFTVKVSRYLEDKPIKNKIEKLFKENFIGVRNLGLKISRRKDLYNKLSKGMGIKERKDLGDAIANFPQELIEERTRLYVKLSKGMNDEHRANFLKVMKKISNAIKFSAGEIDYLFSLNEVEKIANFYLTRFIKDMNDEQQINLAIAISNYPTQKLKERMEYLLSRLS